MKKIVLVLMLSIGVYCCITDLIGAVPHGESCPSVELTYAQRQMIAIDFMCGPGQHWKGMSAFCGAQILDGTVGGNSDGSVLDAERSITWQH